jgi:predicted metal-binding protein
MPDQPAQLPTREETLAAIHLASCQMREATRGSYRVISESNELLAQTDKVLSRHKRQ